MLVAPKYLSAAVKEFDVAHGKVEAFMESKYGITDRVRMVLRDRYLH